MSRETHKLKEARLTSNLLVKYKAYYEAIKEDKCLEEVKKIRIEIKEIEKELRELLSEKGS